eukprot:g71218.t1
MSWFAKMASSLFRRSALSTRPSLCMQREGLLQRPLSTETPPKIWLLEYKYVDGILDKRGPYRPAHLEHAKKQLPHLLKGGAFPPPPLTHSALFIFKGKEKGDWEAFVKADPYAKNGLVKSWSLNEWTVLVGSEMP